MTEPEYDASPIEWSHDEPPEVDWFLVQLVQWANDLAIETPVTLFLGGMVVSGHIISGRAYFDGFADTFTEAAMRRFSERDPEADAELRATLASLGDRYSKLSMDERMAAGEDIERATATSFIHLRNARFYVGSTFAPTNGAVMWRGRIAEVKGFVIGALGEGPLDDD